MNDPARSSDEELADSLSAPDDHAITALAGRYTQPLYDFCLRATLDPAVAAAVTRESFDYLRAHAAERPAQTSVRAWLFGFAQERVLDVASDRTRGPEVRLSPGDRRFTQTGPGVDREVVLWAWQAARSLRPKDYCLLDLTLRRGLTTEDVGGAAAQGRGGVYTALGRARGAFEEAYVATALYFRGRATCSELSELVGGSGATMRVGIRRQIAVHVENCDACKAALAVLPAAAQVFAELGEVELPPELPQQILAGLGQAAVAGKLTLDDAAPVIEPAPEEETAAAMASEEQMWAEPEEIQAPVATEAGYQGDELAPVAALEETGSAKYAPVDWEQTPAQRFEPPQRGRAISFGAAYGGGGMKGRLSRWSRSLPLGSLLWSYVWLGVSTAVAIYLGIAVADSLRGGGGDSGDVPLDSKGVFRNIPCDSGPFTLSHGTTEVLQFDPKALDGFEIGSVVIKPESTGAAANGLTAQAQGGSALQVQAAKVQSTTARTDQFLMQIAWQRGDEAGLSDCNVVVNVTPSAAP